MMNIENTENVENPFLIDIPDKAVYTIDDYINIQKQLSNKNIDHILDKIFPPKEYYFEYHDFKYRCTKSLKQKIIDIESNKLPTKKLYKIGNTEHNKNCFVCCVPFSHDLIKNGTSDSESRYIASQQIIKSLTKSGYNGYLYLITGGFPTPTGTEMKYEGVPYCFKIFAMLEAQNLGFDKVIWIDSACYCINNPKYLFDILDNDDTLFYTVNYDNQYNKLCFQQTIDILNKITNNNIEYAVYVQTVVFGLNLKSPIIKELIQEYYNMVKIGLPFLSIFPEEVVLSALFNQPKYKHLLYNQPIIHRLRVDERGIDEENARNHGFYFLHRNYNNFKKYVDNEMNGSC